MNRKQWFKFIGWVAFSVFLPVLVYPAAFVIAMFAETRFTLRNALASGDLLFLVVILLAAVINWIILDFRERPQKSREESLGKELLNYGCFTVALLGLILYTMVYGWLITRRLSDVTTITDIDALTWFCGLSLVGWSIFCGGVYYRLLKDGRI